MKGVDAPVSGSGSRDPKRRAGYTLIEMLITLVIVALVTGLVFDGVGGTARLSLRLADASEKLDRASLAAEWFRQSVAGALPAEGPLPPQLVGDGQTLRLSTMASLHDRIGAPRMVEWRLSKTAGGGVELVYAFGDQSWVVAQTPKGDPRFTYRGEGGAALERWAEREPPRLVALEGFFDDPILASPRTRRLPEQPGKSPDDKRR